MTLQRKLNVDGCQSTRTASLSLSYIFFFETKIFVFISICYFVAILPPPRFPSDAVSCFFPPLSTTFSIIIVVVVAVIVAVVGR